MGHPRSNTSRSTGSFSASRFGAEQREQLRLLAPGSVRLGQRSGVHPEPGAHARSTTASSARDKISSTVSSGVSVLLSSQTPKPSISFRITSSR